MRSSLAIKVEKYPSCCIRSSENHARTLHPSLTFLLDDHSSIQLLVASLLPQRLDVPSYDFYINTKSASSIMFLIKDICGYFHCAPFLASANGESCLGPVFRPLTDSDQHSFRYSYVISVFRHFLHKISD